MRTFAKPQDSIIYTLQVHTSTGCIFYDTYTLDVIRRPESTAVIPNNNLGLKVDDHSIVVESNVEIFQDYSVEILGISGEVLVRQKITDNKMRISTSGISAGPYLATVLDQYDEIVFRKWIYLNN
ncbi:MAG: hypothetical protein KDC76_12950 [Bacteroidetes bacterium]|nr:hypothetical protein [Bacteroidota bacterium]